MHRYVLSSREKSLKMTSTLIADSYMEISNISTLMSKFDDCLTKLDLSEQMYVDQIYNINLRSSYTNYQPKYSVLSKFLDEGIENSAEKASSFSSSDHDKSSIINPDNLSLNNKLHYKLCEIDYFRGSLDAALGNYERSKTYYQDSLQDLRQLFGDDHPMVLLVQKGFSDLMVFQYQTTTLYSNTSEYSSKIIMERINESDLKELTRIVRFISRYTKACKELLGNYPHCSTHNFINP